jgi:hypothetical protein
MPNLIEQRIAGEEIYLRASNGREVKIERSEIDALLKAAVGDDKTKATVVSTFLCKIIADSLGTPDKDGKPTRDMLGLDEIGLVIDPENASAKVLVTGQGALAAAAIGAG